MVRLFWCPQTENFQSLWNFLKGSPKFPTEISERKMCLPTLRSWPVPSPTPVLIRIQGNASKGITLLPNTFHRDESFHLNSPRNYRKFHSKGPDALDWQNLFGPTKKLDKICLCQIFNLSSVGALRHARIFAAYRGANLPSSPFDCSVNMKWFWRASAWNTTKG